MSDAARVAREWLYERSLSLDRTEDLAAMLEAYAAERTAAVRAELAEATETIVRQRTFIERVQTWAANVETVESRGTEDEIIELFEDASALLAAPEAAP